MESRQNCSPYLGRMGYQCIEKSKNTRRNLQDEE